MAEQVAVFLDFENIVISAEQSFGRCDLGAILLAAERWGRCIIRRAYGDWTRFEQYRYQLTAHALELIQLFHYGPQQKKNAADIQMVVDALETAFTHPDIGVFVLVTGDSDFSAVARKLRSYGKMVVGIGLRRATSEVLVKACDHFVLYDHLVEPDTRSKAFSLERARHLLLEAMRRLAPADPNGKVFATRLKQVMLSQDPTFREISLGFDQFKDFLEAQADLVELSTRNETDLLVTLRPSARQEPLGEEMAHYRAALNAAGLHLVEPNTRSETLRDLFQLLTDYPGRYTLEQAIFQLKAQYDTANVLRSLDEVQEVAKLVRYADVMEGVPQSWEMDPLTLRQGVSDQDMIDRCECAYIVALLQRNLIIEPDLLALLLFGTLDQRARVEHLLRLSQEAEIAQQEPICQAGDVVRPAFLQEAPELEILCTDLDGCTLDEQVSIERARELANEGSEIRTADFGHSTGYFLRAAKMMCELLHRGEQGSNLTDLKWYLAGYCAAAAGADFNSGDLVRAGRYYLAFFALAKETDPVWDRVRGLARPMLTYYFALAARQSGLSLGIPLGLTEPARLLLLLNAVPDERVGARWQQLARDLAHTNVGLVRMIARRLDQLEKQEEGLVGTQQVRDFLTGLTEPIG